MMPRDNLLTHLDFCGACEKKQKHAMHTQTHALTKDNTLPQRLDCASGHCVSWPKRKGDASVTLSPEV